MAQYKSKYAELSFYVDGSIRKFSNGTFKTENKTETAVLDKLTDATRVDEPKTEIPKVTESNAEEIVTDVKPTPRRKSSAK